MSNDESNERHHATREMIAFEFANVLRNLMRAMVSQTPDEQTVRAALNMQAVLDILDRSDLSLRFDELFLDGVLKIRHVLDSKVYDQTTIDAALYGLKYLIEESSTGAGAAGRTSQSLEKFLKAAERAVH